MHATVTRPLTLDMAGRVRRIPAGANVVPATTTTEQLQWLRKQATKEASERLVPVEIRHHVLYRFYDADNVLLYVGITADLPTRFRNHSRKPWWHDIGRMTVEHFSCRFDVLAAEKLAIASERPLYNSTYNTQRWRQ